MYIRAYGHYIGGSQSDAPVQCAWCVMLWPSLPVSPPTIQPTHPTDVRNDFDAQVCAKSIDRGAKVKLKYLLKVLAYVTHAHTPRRAVSDNMGATMRILYTHKHFCFS